MNEATKLHLPLQGVAIVLLSLYSLSQTKKVRVLKKETKRLEEKMHKQWIFDRDFRNNQFKSLEGLLDINKKLIDRIHVIENKLEIKIK